MSGRQPQRGKAKKLPHVPVNLREFVFEDWATEAEMDESKLNAVRITAGTMKPNLPGHTPRFFAADESIFVGSAVLAETARVASASLARR